MVADISYAAANLMTWVDGIYKKAKDEQLELRKA
jgi:hypothetical protein